MSGKTESENSKVELSKKYLVFVLNRGQYAVPLSEVREVIGLPTYVSIPGAPFYSLGLVNLRGRVINAIDLKKRIGIEATGQLVKRPAVIITDCGAQTVGCAVDSIIEVLTIEHSQIERGSDMAAQVASEFIDGIARFTDRSMILILDLRHTVGVDIQEKLGSAS